MKIIYADTETTGLDHKEQEMVQFAFIIEVDKQVVAEENLKMRPARPDKASADALKITGKTIEDLLAYPERRAQYGRILEILGRHIRKFDKGDKLIWVGHNPSFDMRFVRSYFEEHGDVYFGSWFDNRPADTVSLAVAASMRGHFKVADYKLGTLCAHFGIPLEAHDAMNDVRATRALFHTLMGRYMLPPPVKDDATKPLQAEVA